MISAESLSKHFGDLVAVDRVSLEVRPGEIYGFVGLNGAGKTTMIRMLLGMIRPTGGSAHLFGERVSAGRRDLWARVGYLVESPYSYPELTVYENLEVVRRLRRLDGSRAIDRIMDRLRLTPYRDRRARHLSLGNKQRLGLAKALIHEPELLILDEPTNGLDPAGIAEVRELLGRLAAEDGVAIFLSSHLLGEVARLVTHLGIIDRGRLIAETDSAGLERLLRQRLLVRTRVEDQATALGVLRGAGYDAVGEAGSAGALIVRGRRAVEDPAGVATLLVEAGAPPTHLEVEAEDLEAYFLRAIREVEPGEVDDSEWGPR